MNKCFFKVSALTAGLSAVSGLAIADNMGLSIVGQFGMSSLLGSDGLARYTTADNQITFNPGSPATELTETMTDDQVTANNNLINEPSAAKDFVWDAGLRFSYDFGDDKDEMFGVELGARFFMNKHTASFKNAAATNESDRTNELNTGISLSGMAVDLSARIIPMHFDGGYMVVTVGGDSRFNFLGKDFVTVQRAGSDMIFGTDEERNRVKNAINGMNFAAKLGVGANFVDEMIHVSLNARYWFMDQVNRADTELRRQDPAISRLSLGQGLDATLSLGFNMMPLFA